MKKRLLITTDCFYPRIDGIAVYLKNLVPLLDKQFDITIIAPKFKGKLPKLNAEIIQIPLGFKIADIGIAQYPPRIVKKAVEEADVILNNTLGTIGLATIRAAKKLKKPIASYVHSYETELFPLSVDKCKSLVRWLTKKYVRWAYRSVNKIIFPSFDVKAAFKQMKITTDSEIVDVKIPLKVFKPKKHTNKTFTFGYCGRLGREKDIDTLIEAFATLKKEAKAKLVIVGEGLRSLKSKAKREGVTLTGRVENPQDLYPKWDAFILPSKTETTSLSTMEAMACGLPIIATPVGKAAEYVEKSRGGILIPKENPELMAKAMLHMMQSDTVRKRYAKNARDYAVKHFDIADSAKELTRILNSLKV